MPTIVICRQGHRGITEFCLACELGLREIRHPDHARTPLTIQPGLPFGRKLRPFDAEIDAALMHGGADRTGRSQQCRTERGADRITKRHVRDDSPLEEGRHPPLGEIDKLIRQHHVPGLDRLLHTPDRTHRNHPAYPERLEGIDIRAIVDFRRIDPMSASMPREKGDTNPVQLAEQHLVGWSPERRSDRTLLDLSKPLDVI